MSIILFDLGNVLVRFSHDRLKYSLSLHAIKKQDESELQDRIHSFFFEKQNGVSRNILLDRGHLKLEEVHEEFLSTFKSNIHNIPFEEFRKIWCSIFDEPDLRALSCLKKVRDLGSRVGICSNTNRYHWEYVCHKCPDYMDETILKCLSYQIGSIKTDPGFFNRIAEMTRLTLESHLLIDDLKENIHAAKAADLHAMLLTKPLDFNEIEPFLREGNWI
jgi:FMN phosphatase YigB (HAD superfamily)